MKWSKFPLILLVVLFLASIVAITAQGQETKEGKEPPFSKPYPMGQVTITLGQVGAGVGVEWGKGTLSYKGKEYTFKVKGMQLGTAGIKKATITGDVYNLFDVGQFAGPYAAAGGGATVIKGKEGLILQNPQGVRLHLRAEEKGLGVNIGPEGFTIVMEKAL